MLEDRNYMRRSPFESRRTATLVLVIVNALIFFSQSGVEQFSTFPIFKYFALSIDGLKQGSVWQLLTYQFMHANFLHLLFNCLAIYVFGLDVEHTLGRARFLIL